MRLILDRMPDYGISTLGRMYVVDNEGFVLYDCCTLELPYLNNQQNISCIPKGQYDVVKRNSARFKDHLHILNVPNRTWILIHSGSFKQDTLGCVLVGTDWQDIDGDEELDLINSKKALSELLNILPSTFTLEIV